ncbi:MAG: sigma-54-dependent Fis family transcriptional regulator [Alphaproteobacteria bacterium]|nr:sigma-54-dependent Fis family transcriptional regulator [Alphaproteobacteria bacterium]
MSEPARKLDEAPGARTSPSWRILVIEDETMFARAVATCLQRAGHAVSVAGTLGEAGRHVAASAPEPPDVVILDMRLPDGDGFAFLSSLAEMGDAAPTVIVVTAYGDVTQAVRAMKMGAADYLKKPVDLDELLVTLDKVMRSARLRARLNYSRTRESHTADSSPLLGNSTPLRELRKQIQTIAGISGDTPPTVLLLGETGTGKDVTARLLHRLSPRADRPFVHVDCASLPEDIMEAELFGHVRGAFTSAHTSRAGLIEAAEDGTVFLDEIGELPAELQAKLLNVLERRLLRRVGSTREVAVAVRFIAATNRDLGQMVVRGEFRDDLYYRLNVLTISLPPLRACRDDIPMLANHFLEATARSYGRPTPVLREDAVEALRAYSWPGNVRELKNVIERSALLSGEEGLTAESFNLVAITPGRGGTRPAATAAASDGEGGVSTLAGAERTMIAQALKETGGNTSEAARRLGVTRMALRYRMEKYGIRAADFAS